MGRTVLPRHVVAGRLRRQQEEIAGIWVTLPAVTDTGC